MTSGSPNKKKTAPGTESSDVFNYVTAGEIRIKPLVIKTDNITCAFNFHSDFIQQFSEFCGVYSIFKPRLDMFKKLLLFVANHLRSDYNVQGQKSKHKA